MSIKPLFSPEVFNVSNMILASPAKINLFLKVTGKRPDGYHEIISLMCPVGLYDSIELKFEGDGMTVECDHPDVPEDETNLVCRAAKLFFDGIGGRPPGIRFRIEKKIPVAAGLGGGSSNAASVLKCLNSLLGKPYSIERLRELGLGIGADVPFFILCKPAIATGIGEKLRLYQGLTEYKVVLVYPNIKVSTARVYKNLNLGLTNCEKKLKNAIFKNWGFDVEKNLCNDLEKVAESWHPEISQIKETLSENGANGVLMSGSGSTVFGLFEREDEAKKVSGRLAGNSAWKVYAVDMLL